VGTKKQRKISCADLNNILQELIELVMLRLLRTAARIVKKNAAVQRFHNAQNSKFCSKDHRLYVYGHTARMLAELPYTNSLIALDLKRAKA
jgi:hypothetical protein